MEWDCGCHGNDKCFQIINADDNTYGILVNKKWPWGFISDTSSDYWYCIYPNNYENLKRDTFSEFYEHIKNITIKLKNDLKESNLDIKGTIVYDFSDHEFLKLPPPTFISTMENLFMKR